MAYGRLNVLGLAVAMAAGAVSLVIIAPAQQPLVMPGLLAAFLLVAVGAKVWERPALGLAGAICLIAVPWPPEGEGREVEVTLPDLAAVAIVGIVVLRLLVYGDGGGRLRSWVMLPAAGVVVAGAVATVAAEDPSVSLFGLVRFAQIFAIVPVVTYLSLRDRLDLKLVLGGVVVLGLFEGGLGIYQYATGTGAEYGEASSRAVGTFGAYGIMGLAQVVTCAILVLAAIYATVRDGRRFVALSLLAVLVLPLVFSFSRGSWLAAIVGVATVLALSSWRKLALFVATGLVAVSLSFAVGGDGANGLTERFTSIFSVASSPDQSVQDRYAMWEAARGMWTDQPLTGIGIKNFPYLRDSYAPLRFSGGSDIADPGVGFRRVELLSPHSLYWLILSEQGLVGAFAYGAFFASLGAAGVMRLGKLKMGSTERVLGLVSIGFLTSYLFDSIYGDIGGSTEVLFAILLGCVMWLASGVDVEGEDA